MIIEEGWKEAYDVLGSIPVDNFLEHRLIKKTMNPLFYPGQAITIERETGTSTAGLVPSAKIAELRQICPSHIEDRLDGI